MARREFRTPLPFSAELVRAYHERPGAFQRLVPPWDPVEVLEQHGTVHEGDRLVMRIPPGVRWEAVHHPLPDGFVDEMVSGPLASWRHAHRFVAEGEGCVIHDEIEFAPDLAGWLADGRLERMFAFRARRLQNDLSRLAGRRAKRVLLAGASGLLGTQLAALLRVGGHDVRQLVRRPLGAPLGAGEVRWDPARGELDPAALAGVDVLVSLSGENVGEGAWTDERKRALVESRLSVTTLLARRLREAEPRPRVWLSASAVGYYGDTGDTEVDEASPRGAGFLAELCERWEAAAEAIPGVRGVHVRFGVVLSARGGALAKMATPFRLGGGGPIGGGRQWFPWISADDAVYGLLHLMFDEARSGPVNLVAPHPVRQGEFATALGAAVHRPALVPLPAFAVRAGFGQMGQEVLLAGQRVRAKALDGRFVFAFPDLADALRWELG